MQVPAKQLSEDDLALIHALQLRPRASWTEFGRALGVHPVTAARHFSRLSARGEAWVGLSPGPRLSEQVCMAFIEIDCAVGSAATVVRTLSGHPHMLTIERAAAAHDLLATVATRDLSAMSHYTLETLPAVPGVSAVHPRIVTRLFTEGGRWRIATLAPDQRAHLTSDTGSVPTSRGPREITPSDRAIIAHLVRDGRASYKSLAATLGSSESTVKRRIDQLIRLGLLRFRCDFARPLGGWPVAVTFWANVPPARLPDIGHSLIRLPEIRNCAAITGTQNLILQASLHSVADVLRFETHLAATHPALDITERVVTLRHDKLLGHLLDPHGRSLSVVPPDIWSDPASPGS
jgi:DNA-binding Lrp family transcriptional regulator